MITQSDIGMSLTGKERVVQILDSIKSQSSESKELDVKEELLLPMEAYNSYKTNYGKNIRFDPFAENFCKYKSVLVLLILCM